MTWLKRLFSTDTVIKTVADGVYNGTDKAFYTSEEKEEDRSKRLDTYLKIIEAMAPYAISRRIISLTISVQWSIAVCANMLLIIFAHPQAAMFFDFTLKVVLPSWGLATSFYFLKRILPESQNK